ncbi:MAG: Appr-1-p processing protein, partial [Burkholderiaceae bacterium]|nr:Appr-1-p processing protein [Burkholderiaceae bacterium]
DLGLRFEKHLYGPYSDQLRHALQRMDGHFIMGLGDGSVDAEIAPIQDALTEADVFLAEQGDAALRDRLARLQRLIEGFQSPYGMELLSTVHWVAEQEGAAQSPQAALAAVQQWNARKKKLMRPPHVEAAWEHLAEQGWITVPATV